MKITTYHGAYNIDQYIESLFPQDKNTGFFVDIGAHNGIDINNTFLFEQKGWDGVCIEPLPEIFELLQKNRKCELVNVALSDFKGKSEFFNIKGYSNMLSGLTSKYEQEHIMRITKEIEEFDQEYEYIEVTCDTFDCVVPKRKIDLLSIDTEGSELDILKTIDFTVYDIDVLVVEYNYYKPELLSFLSEKGFTVINRIGVDLIYRNNKYVHTK